MKVVDRKTFLTLPAGTFYASIWQPIAVEGLMIKDEPRGSNDWWLRQVSNWEAENSIQWADRYFEMVEGASYPIDPDVNSDGRYENKDMFLVFERADLMTLREWIDKAIEVTP